ncbi:MAG TPA: hypothetical protein PLW68_12780, partial [Casimicrobiaceae bacterium]|nr:hypothetical protein [Casimicrobiaceae bacterium]
MFGFLTSGTKEAADPLVSPKAVAAWLRQLPALDVIGRQQQVMQAFEAMKASRKPIDIHRVEAIEYLDAALGADRRQLTKQYVENYDSAPKLAERIWHSIYDLSQGFITAYHAALEEALRQSGNARWKPLAPLLFARLTHYYGTDAKLRVFRYERWIPGKWVELHRTYLRAAELGLDRVPATLASTGQSTTPWTVEQEYIYVLLIHQLNTGNMSPPQLDWATSQLRAWSRRLQVDAVPRSLEGFFVDIAGRAGLSRRTGSDSGSMLRYIDTTPLTEQLDRAIAALRQAESTDQGPAAPINQQRIGILEKVAPSVAPNLNAELRRDRRIECAVTATVRIGLSRICQQLSQKDNGISLAEAGSLHEQIEVFAVADGSRAPRRQADEHDSLVASLSSFSDPMWQVRDRSVAGLRIAASGGIGQSLALGALVGVRQSDISNWVLGVVRRMNKVSTDEVEAGMSIIADRIVAVTLHAVRQAQDDMGFIVDGIDISTMGARFHGLYLPPPSRPDK